MKLKGNVTIELTDVDTGEITAYSEENMATEAVNNIFELNPMGVFYKISNVYDEIGWSTSLLPICPNLIGGILLFPNTLEERTDNIYSLSGNLPVAYASNDVNATADLARGSLNLNESKALDNGYKFVWEFTASQGNGTIAALALTSAKGGICAYGSQISDSGTFQQLKSMSLSGLSLEQQVLLYMAVEMDFDNNLLYSIDYQDTGVRIRKVRIPVFTLGLNENINDATLTAIKDTIVQTTTFRFLGSYTKYGEFLDGRDGYWYGFSNQANSSGSATMLWVKILKEDCSMTEGSWSLSNAKLVDVGSRDSSNSPTKRISKCCIRGGFLYVPAYDWKGIYKINLANVSDITLIEFGFTSQGKPLGDTGTSELYMALIGDLIIGSDFQVTGDDRIIPTQGSKRLNYTATPLFQYKNFMLGWGGFYSSNYRTMYLLTPYLATINNLSSAVVKTTDKTMKISYTLTEEA